MPDVTDICSMCGASRSADDVRVSGQALMALGHYVHYATGERARDATIATLVAIVAPGTPAVRLCPRCVCRGLALSDPVREADPNGDNTWRRPDS
ncbi:MAG: hypothetical protein AB7R89_15890 [Dehalococcoidia bacterium]